MRDLPLTALHCLWDTAAALTPPHLVTARPHEDLTEERLLVAEAMAGPEEKYPDVRTRVEIARGRPDECLAVMSRRADLLVVGTAHGRSRLAFGSVAASVVEHATCAVAVVPTAD